MSCIWESNSCLNKGNTFREVKLPVNTQLFDIIVYELIPFLGASLGGQNIIFSVT